MATNDRKGIGEWRDQRGQKESQQEEGTIAVDTAQSLSFDNDRPQWANKTEFILSCLGYSIGIGNVWRFPYLAYRNGGGAFLIPYLIMLVVCGIPLYFMEIAMGQFSSQACITFFRICPLFKGTGYAMVLVNFLCSTYYNIVLTYPIYFMYLSFRSPLPWEHCNNSWNTPACYKVGSKLFTIPPAENSSVTAWRTPADEFFHNGMLQISEGIEYPGGIVWQLLVCDLLSWLIMFLCIMNGVKSVGKVVYFTAPFPYVILFIFLVRGVTLPGSTEGVLFFIYPDWKQLLNIKVWVDAAVQLFFALGSGWGGILSMASYNYFRNNIKSESVCMPIINCATSIFCGFVIFSVLGYMSHVTGLPVSKVATEGAGLAYVVYPEAISMMPFPQLWSFLFFFMLYVLGMDTLFVMIEAIIGSLTDEFPDLRPHKKLVTLAAVLAMALVSISMVTNGGIYVLQLLDAYCVSIPVIFTCFIETTIMLWIYGSKNFKRDVEFMIERPLHWLWMFILKYITEFVLLFIFIATLIFYTRVSYNNIEYPDWAVAVGWMTAVISMILIPGFAIYQLIKTPGTCKEMIGEAAKQQAEAAMLMAKAALQQAENGRLQNETTERLIGVIENQSFPHCN
ncbi:sodium- and chloride-dependent glycine transporter 1-like [Anabrus simplex]|uniref:sodium- and chloride-dependent glycine transporter 1-like n=1 Tax=Anabrus simplex TaxID=316456 RepID=UPI0035A3BA0A